MVGRSARRGCVVWCARAEEAKRTVLYIASLPSNRFYIASLLYKLLNIVMCVVCIGVFYVCMGKGAIYNSSLQLVQEPYIINTSPSSCAP